MVISFRIPIRSCLLYLLLNIVLIEGTSSPLQQCELFVAESTLPNAGLGMFSAVQKMAGDSIGDGDLALPLLDIDRTKKSRVVFDDYFWSGLSNDMSHESNRWAINAVGFGLYSAPNSFIPLVNIQTAFPLLHSSFGHDLPYMPHRSIDPGAGAVTTYRAAKTIVDRKIPAGGEVFVSYGDIYFSARPHLFGENLPLSRSFREAYVLLKRTEAFDFTPLHDAILNIREIWKSTSRVINALPPNHGDLNLALEKGVEEIYQKNATRSLEWLWEHGTCVDHTSYMPSTIAGSGEGAFAKRRLPKGTVITGSPLWTFEDDGYLNLGDDGEYDRSHMKQILYNYCFGHETTSLLFLPYASAGALYINHGSEKKANVGVQWANPGKLRHDPSLFDLSPDQIMDKQNGPQLGIEYIALRDIEEGDELFLDYGDKWEEAWDEHVKNWRPVKDNTIASDWNAAGEPIRTKEEEILNPYPASINLRCHSDLLSQDESKWTEMEWSRHESGKIYGHSCEVLERSPDNSTYLVSFETESRENVPRKALYFLDSPHKSDLFLENAFRYTIQLPDEMVPEAWRNKNGNPPAGASGRDEL
jgi:hypothetical protein